MREERVVMLMSTIIVDKDNALRLYKQKNGALAPFFLLNEDFLHRIACIGIHGDEVNTPCNGSHGQGIQIALRLHQQDGLA